MGGQREVIASPNIWHHPEVYELENRYADPDGLIEISMTEIRDWSGCDILDVGCGTGYHLPNFARSARSVIGVEPHGPLVSLAKRRTARLTTVSVRKGTAQDLPVDNGTIDVAHARWAYFFGPGSEPGLAELTRVMRRDGVAFVVDNDSSRSTFGRWFRQAYPMVDADTVERFWTKRGWERQPLDIEWRFPTRAAFEAVVRIEFAPQSAEAILLEHDGSSVDYAVNLWWRRF